MRCSFLKQIPELRTPLFHAQFLHDIHPVLRVRRPSDVGLRSAGLPSPQVVSGRVNWSLMMLINSPNCTRFSTRTVVLSAQHPQWLGPSRAETVSFPVQSPMSREECDKSDKLDILHNVCNILPFFHTTINNQHDAIRLRNVVNSECWKLTIYIVKTFKFDSYKKMGLMNNQ